MARYYFRKDDEYCYTIECHYDYMRENGLKLMKVFEAEYKPDKSKILKL